MTEMLSVQAEQKVRDIPGRLMSRVRVRQIYGDEGHIEFWKFVTILQEAKQKYSKFCVSGAKTPFARDDEMRFYEIRRYRRRGLAEIMYLGQGGTSYTPKIYNQYAADTWGFAVLKMKEKKDEIKD